LYLARGDRGSEIWGWTEAKLKGPKDQSGDLGALCPFRFSACHLTSNHTAHITSPSYTLLDDQHELQKKKRA